MFITSASALCHSLLKVSDRRIRAFRAARHITGHEIPNELLFPITLSLSALGCTGLRLIPTRGGGN